MSVSQTEDTIGNSLLVTGGCLSACESLATVCSHKVLVGCLVLQKIDNRPAELTDVVAVVFGFSRPLRTKNPFGILLIVKPVGEGADIAKA